MDNFQEKANFIWGVADLLRGDYKQSQYGDVILPLTVLRRLDQVLIPTKEKVLEAARRHAGSAGLDLILRNASGRGFYNTSKYTFQRLLEDPNNLAINLRNHIAGYSINARKILENFRFEEQIDRLDGAKILYKVIQRFSEVDLHPDRVTNREMGYIFEELIRKFSEISNETAGEHFTPRDVVRLMVSILLTPDDATLTKKGIIRKLYDPACGTGGMLSVAEEYIQELNPNAELVLFGQELNPESYAICVSDMLIKGQDPDRIKLGNSFSDDQLKSERFDYMLCNPPFGVDWKKVKELVTSEHEQLGFAGRFGAGLPHINDGAMLFLMHMLSKMKAPGEGGSRIGVVLSGSPLFQGGAGSGESNIRKWIVENDWLEAIIALPDGMFYNANLSTYLWFLSNRKSTDRRGKVQLIDGSSFSSKMRKSLGEKRNEMGDDQVTELVKCYGDFRDGKLVRIFPTTNFGYRRVTIERPLRMNFRVSPDRLTRLEGDRRIARMLAGRTGGRVTGLDGSDGKPLFERVLTVVQHLPPGRIWKSRAEFMTDFDAALANERLRLPSALFRTIVAALGERDETAEICIDDNGQPEPDPELRDYENVPLGENLGTFMDREILPFFPDAWVNLKACDERDGQVGTLGYEINFNRFFYEHQEGRSLSEVDKEIGEVERSIIQLLDQEFR